MTHGLGERPRSSLAGFLSSVTLALLLAVPLHAQSVPSAGDIANTSTRPDPTTTTTSTVGPSSQSSTLSFPPATSAGPTQTAPPPASTVTPPEPNPSRGPTSVTTPGRTPNPGDFAEDVARAEAERTVGAAKPVIRLDKPENVFNSTDPEVAAGFQAWIGTLKFPHDQYGNFKGPGYKGSYRPDSVNKELLAFLVNYLKDKRIVALSAGQASSFVTARDKGRADAIEALVRAKREQASQAATPPGTGTTGRENVPNIGAGGDSRTPAGPSQPNTTPTTRAGSTGPSAGTTGSGSSTPPTTGGGQRSSAPTTARELEAKFSGVTLADQPKAFTTQELGFLDDVLGKVPSSFFQKTQLQRTPVISVDGVPDNRIFGLARTSATAPNSIIEVSDKNVSENGAERFDFPTPPYPADQSKMLQFQATVAHELTHRFLRFNPGDTYYSDIGKNPLIAGENGWAAKFGWTFDPTQQKWAIDPKRKAEGPTLYSVSDNPNEDIAESVMIYLYDPMRLRTASPERYSFVRDVLKVAEQPDATVTYPPPKNDPRHAQEFAQQ